MQAEIIDGVVLALDVEEADPPLAYGHLTARPRRDFADARDRHKHSRSPQSPVPKSPVPYFPLTTGFPACTHSFHPPRSARMLFTPRSFSISAARALVASSTQAQ